MNNIVCQIDNAQEALFLDFYFFSMELTSIVPFYKRVLMLQHLMAIAYFRVYFNKFLKF